MRISLFLSIMLIGVQTIFAAGQTVAVLPSEGGLKDSELEFFTDKALEIAVRVLPKSGFEVFPKEVVIKRLGGADSYMKECKESSCIVDLGRKAMVDYVAQCRFGKFGSDLAVSFELYKVSTSGLIDKFSETAKNINGLRAVMEKRIPDGFMKIPGAALVNAETSGPQSKPKNEAEAYYKRGNAYGNKGDYDKAISDFNEAIRLDPNLGLAYYTRGIAYYYKEDYNMAIADYESALRINPNDSKAKNALSKARNALENKTASPSVAGGVFTDKRDGKKYKVVKIGNQTWMAENLNYNAKGSKCYENKPAYCEEYGRLYNWNTALKACPSGWHLPKKKEWDELVDFAGGEEVAGKKLKAKSGWNRYQGKSGNGTNDYGFSALPGGGGRSDGSFDDVDYYGHWWSASESNSYGAYRRNMGYDYSEVGRYNRDKSYLFSVRCLQD